MQSKNYQKAIKAWHDVLKLSPKLPEAHVNMGFSLYELEEYDAAKNFFISAMELNPYQANAYYGLAIAYEKQGDLEAAIGAMRSYIHLASAGDFIRKARSALWEWEALLKNRNDLPDNESPAQ
jgi:tetratricopeptide (TPR) repeat protein